MMLGMVTVGGSADTGRWVGRPFRLGDRLGRGAEDGMAE
jgi:hypothetical protein